MKMHTPLLEDKLRQGFAHAVLVLDGDAIFSIPGVGLLAQNTKAWRARAAYEPATEPVERDGLLKQWSLGRRRGLEVLVPYGLSLGCLKEIVFLNPEHRDIQAQYISIAHPEKNWTLVLDSGTDRYDAAVVNTELTKYLEACIELGSAPLPPHIPFD